ncbi:MULTISPECIES: rod shape-determining protein MreD [Helcococcus]|uniref:Rod shape-determining protein MreD n=1 Tax=Helcococcus bovis TaxID=3153252 RepID=A0ABW9F681_9FIRM
MKGLKIIILFIINLLVDLTILSKYNLYGVVPSITIPLIIVLSIYAKKENIVYYGLFQGLIQDIAFGNTLGVKALLFYLISYYVYSFNINEHKNLAKNYVYLIIAIIFKKIYVIVMNLIIYRNPSVIFKELFNFSILIEIIVSLVFFTFINFIMYRIEKNKLRSIV